MAIDPRVGFELPQGFRISGRGIRGQRRVKGTLRISDLFPFDTKRNELIRWWNEQPLIENDGEAKAQTGTLAGDCDKYLATFVKGSRRWKDEVSRLRRWKTSAVGTKPRHAIEATELRAIMAHWVSDDKIERTTANRILATLQALYRCMNKSKADPNPAAHTEKFEIDERVPGGRAIPFDQVQAILAAMPDLGVQMSDGTRDDFSLTKKRFYVQVYTGLTPKLISQIVPRTDIHGNGWELLVRPRKKGGGTRERMITLNAQAVVYLQDLIKAVYERHPERRGHALGEWSTKGAYKVFQRAVRKVRRAQQEENAQRRLDGREPVYELPADSYDKRGKKIVGVRPYDLRHSFGTESLERDPGNIKGVSHNMVHSTLQQTQLYTRKAEMSQARHATQAWDHPVQPAAPTPAEVFALKKQRG